MISDFMYSPNSVMSSFPSVFFLHDEIVLYLIFFVKFYTDSCDNFRTVRKPEKYIHFAVKGTVERQREQENPGFTSVPPWGLNPDPCPS
jgi:hypothetical protein